MAGLIEALDSLLSGHGSSRPVVLFSAAGSIAHTYGDRAKQTISDLISHLSNLTSNRDILLPAFPKENSGAPLDLEKAPSNNGVIAEEFRKAFNKNRSTSYYFPFTCAGPSSEGLLQLQPEFAWGEGSIYSWIEECDAVIVTIGVHPTVCSFQHRAEFKEASILDYRETLFRENTLVRDGTSFICREGLLARKAGISVDFKPALSYLKNSGLEVRSHAGITISAMSARSKLNTIQGLLRKNPRFFASEVGA